MNHQEMKNRVNEETESKTAELIVNKKESYSLAPKTITEAMEFAKMLANSSMVPDNFKGKPGDIVAAMQLGHEVGLGPMQALRNIAVINGKPCIWGDAMLALVQNHPHFEYIKEEDDGMTATCTVKRKGSHEHTVKFSMEDAKKAGLLDKKSPWQTYPKRMRQMRARGFALRDQFSDALNGLISREEAQDYNKIKKQEPIIVHKSCSEKQVKEIKNLLDELQIDQEKQNLWLEKLDVASFNDLSFNQAEKCINSLNKKLMSAEKFEKEKNNES